MKTAFRNSFLRDVKKITQKAVRNKVDRAIELVEQAESIEEISNLKMLAGAENCYRIRIGRFRIGVFIEGDTVEFVRCLHRRELYRHFP